MHLVYYDEAGDDGFPKYSSPLFVMTACYLHHLQWRDTYAALCEMRRSLKRDYNVPVRMELHWKHFLLNKKPYRSFEIADADKLDIAGYVCDFLAGLNIQFINVCIVKPRANTIAVLDTAFKFSIQRIENDLNPRRNPENTFMIITDTGRVGKMRSTSRKIQRVNFIPSKFGPTSYRREIRALVEDPLPKDSKESHFIQACDLVASVVYYHRLLSSRAGTLPSRMPQGMNQAVLEDWLDRLEPSLNTRAASDDKWGIKEHPK